MKQLILLGIRGVPAQHGGFETFAEYLCRYLVSKGWEITVYCQEDGKGGVSTSEWEGVERIHLPIPISGPLGTVLFDLWSVLHSLRHKGVFLTLGYNTAVFNVFHRIFRKRNVINMDGIEWKRQKWGRVAKVWFWLNERFGCWFGNHLVADHPRIEDHLATRVSREKITMIPYGGAGVATADEALLAQYGLTPDSYTVVIARPEPENSILELVQAFCADRRDGKLVLLGNYEPDSCDYHRSVIDAANDSVLFLGAIYDADKVAAIRKFARAYLHGHQVGGTNPSLVEALGAGCAVLAHDNQFNRWVVDDAAIYFSDLASTRAAFDAIYSDDVLIENLRARSQQIFQKRFQWESILSQYESLLLQWLPK